MKLVICEGVDDQLVLEELLKYLGRTDVVVEQCKGTGNLSRYLRDLPIRPEFARNEVESLGVMIDADTDGDGSWRKVVDLVRSVFKTELASRGVAAGERPRIIGFVNGVANQGTLEDVCLEAVRNHPGYPCLEDYFRCLAQNTPRNIYPTKAKFRAWMASQSDFDLRTGTAAQGGYLPWESEAFEPLRAFLSAL